MFSGVSTDASSRSTRRPLLRTGSAPYFTAAINSTDILGGSHGCFFCPPHSLHNRRNVPPSSNAPSPEHDALLHTRAFAYIFRIVGSTAPQNRAKFDDVTNYRHVRPISIISITSTVLGKFDFPRQTLTELLSMSAISVESQVGSAVHRSAPSNMCTVEKPLASCNCNARLQVIHRFQVRLLFGLGIV